MNLGKADYNSHPGDSRIRVVAYLADRWEHVCPILRLLDPAELEGHRIIQGSIWKEGDFQVFPERVANGDIVIIQRNFPSFSDEYEQVITQAHSLGKPVVYELDDLLSELPEEHPDFYHYLTARTAILRAIIQADAVIGSTPALCDYLRTYNPHTWLFPNYLDDRLWQVRLRDNVPSKAVTIGYMGGHSHSYDLEIVTSPILEILQRYGKKVVLKFWGVRPPKEIRDFSNVDWIDLGLVDYGEFAEYFSGIDADIFIAPLQDNLFNRCKSHLKFLEYSALRVPGVYSQITPYESVVTHGVNGFLAKSSEEWVLSLSRLIEEPDLRTKIGQEAQSTVRSNWLLSQHALEWVKVYEEILSMGNRQSNTSDGLKIAQKMHFWQRDLEEKVSKQASEIQQLKGQMNLQGEQLDSLKLQLAERNAKVQHIYGLYNEIMNSTGWKILQLLFRIRMKVLPRGSRREEFLRSIVQAFRALKNEGVRVFVKGIFRSGGVWFKSERSYTIPPVGLKEGAKLATRIIEGVMCPTPAISVLKIRDVSVSPPFENVIYDWVRSQTISDVEVVVWDKIAKVAYVLDQNELNWEAPDISGFQKGLRSRYLCIANHDLLNQDRNYLERNLIALETESLAFTVNLKDYSNFARKQLEIGLLPGDDTLPLLRHIVRKDCVREDFSIDLSSWIREKDEFPITAGKIILQTTNERDTRETIPFKQHIPDVDSFLIGERILIRPQNEIPWELALQSLHPVESVLPFVAEPSDHPTVLLAIQFLAVGGAERLALHIIRNLNDRIRFVVLAVEGLDPTLGTTADDFRLATPLTYTIPDFLDYSLNFSFLRYLIERYQPVTLYIANGSNWLYDSLGDIKTYFPNLRMVNQVYDHQVGWINRYDLNTVLNLDAHIGANEKICQAYVDLGVKPEFVHFIEHGIDPAEVNPADYPVSKIRVLKNLLGLPQEKKIITFAARFHPQKRPIDFVELARRLSSDTSLAFLMVGDGLLGKAVDEQIAHLDLKNIFRQKFYQPISDIYAISDLLVLPSEYEAMPLVIAETQAMGKPVVATDVGNNREVLEMTGGGVIVDKVGDIAGLIQGVNEMLTSPPDPYKVREIILSRFGIGVIADQYRKVLLEDKDA
jgi:glycosyltransferase involved in cell wall biosynthesis